MRKLILAAASVAVLALAGPASAQSPIIIKFSHVVAPNTPKGLASEKFKELAEKYTDAAESPSTADLTVLDKLFTYEPVALTLGRNDDDFRLVVDRALSRAFKADDFPDVYSKWFGAPDDAVLGFFRQSAMPE